ncbi:MAG: signal peptidase I [Bacilli bacterium]|nr:signal peptidase I [Bacilli bacterium]
MFKSKRMLKNYLICFLILAYTLVYKFFIFSNFMKYSSLITASFLVVVFGLSIILLGIRKDKIGYMSQNLLRVVVLYLGLAFLIMYGLGFIIGFLRNAYSRSFTTLFDNLFAPVMVILFVEGIRYVVIWANRDKKIFLVLFSLLLAFFEIMITARSVDYSSLASVFSLFATIILPVIIKNLVMSYLCYHSGYRVPLIYRLVMDTYFIIVPILPNIGEYLNSMILIALPLLIYIHCFTLVDERTHKVEHVFETYQFSILDIPTTIVIVTLAALISGFFPHYMIGIGSSSMSPNINRGDAVIIKKINKNTKLKVGDIIAYKEDKITIVHRIHELQTYKNKEAYLTKGDANNGADNYIVPRDHVKGVIKLRVPFIAYPTIWLSEMFKKR